MNEIDDIQFLAHEIIAIETVILPCRNLLRKNTDNNSKKVTKILERMQKRIEFQKEMLNSMASHENSCYKFGCLDRQKFPERDPHEKDHGSWS